MNCRSLSLKLFVAGTFALLLSSAEPCFGQDKVYDSNGFEPKPFVTGGPLLGSDGWSAAIPPFLNPAAATITNADGANGRRSVEVKGADLASSEGITAPYDAVGSFRRPVGYTVSSRKPVVVVEADLLLETDEPATTDDFFSVTIAARSGDGETLGEIGLSSSGEAVAYGFDVAAGTDPVIRVPTRLNQWHRVSIVLDYSGATTIVSYWLDGELRGALPAASDSRVLARGAMVVYALPGGAGESRANYTARLDNFQISAHGKND